MSTFEWVAAGIIAVIASARITRLVVHDKYPPSMRLRMKWDEITNDGPWSVLAHCGYCFGLWAAGFVVGTAGLSLWLADTIHWTWWLFHGWLAAGYLASVFMAFDGDD